MTRGRYGWALAIVAVGAFMITMDNTVVNVALPTIREDLGMSSGAVQWVATGYILMFSCLMIAGGRLADVYGCRIVFVSGMIIFTAASLAAGLAHSDVILILARVVQGAGSALALPATLVIVNVGRTDKQKSLGTTVWIAAAAVAIAAGPFVGGFIASHWDWGWIFLINVLPGVLVVLLGLVVVGGPHNAEGVGVDLPGVLASATALFAFTYALEAGDRMGWASPAVLGMFGLAAVGAVAFVLVERWSPHPMISLEFFQNRVFTGGIVSQMLWGMGFNGVMFYASFFLQDVLGFRPAETGLVFLPPAMVLLVLTPVSFWVAAKVGSRITIGGGMLLMAGGMATFSLLRQGHAYPELMPGVMLVGIGSAMCMPLAMYVLKSVPDERAGVASGILNVVREMSGAFGITVLGVIVIALKESALRSGESAAEAFRQGASAGLLVGGALVVIGALVSGVTLPSKRGWAGPKHQRRRLTPRPRPALAPPAPAAEAPPQPAAPPVAAEPAVGPNSEPVVVPRYSREPDSAPVPVAGPVGPWPTPPGAWPPPPAGWYRPYDPDERDGGEAAGWWSRRYRGDAW